MTLSSASIGANWFLNGTANLQLAEVRTQRQISSGFRVQDASDAPAQTGELVGLETVLANEQSYQSNLGRVQAEVNSADSGLGSAISLIESARTLAQQGAGTSATSQDRQTLVAQVQSIQQGILAIANTSVEGRYIFGGDQDQAKTYQLNPASPTGVDKLTAQTATRVISDPAGQLVYQSTTAATIFDHTDSAGAVAPDNVFAALQSLVTGLQNNDTNGIAGALTSLEASSGWLNQQQALYGLAGQRITSELTTGANLSVSLRASISGIRDTDIVQAATDLTQESTAQSAAFSAQAQIPRKSLFDYLG